MKLAVGSDSNNAHKCKSVIRSYGLKYTQYRNNYATCLAVKISL